MWSLPVKSEMRPMLIMALVLPILASCGEKKQAAPSRAMAAGEVLPGSVSDAMLPVDTVRSQPPLAPKTEPGAGKGGKPNAADKAASDSPAEADPAAEAPAEAPPPPPPPPAAQ